MTSEKPINRDDLFGTPTPFNVDVDVAPAVITGEAMEGDGRDAGEMAYVLTEQEISPGDKNAMVKLLHVSTGEVAVLAYSSLERLVDCCGGHQPWVAFRATRIDALREVTGADVLLWDEELPVELRIDTHPWDVSGEDHGRL